MCLCALGPGFVSGREIAFFYSQTGKWSHPGVLLCGVLYGMFVGLTVRFARKTAAHSFPQIFRRSMGVYAGGTIWMLHIMALLLMGWLALAAAGKAAELILSLRHGRVFGMTAAVIAAMLVRRKKAAAWGLLFAMLLLLYLLALLLGGRMPPEAKLFEHTRLKLRDSLPSALLLALMHACRCMSVSAGLAVTFSKDIRPTRLGLFAGVWMCALLEAGNMTFQKNPVQLMALEQPFSAMLAQWGKGGYYCAAIMLFAVSALTLSGMRISLSDIMDVHAKNRC